MANERWLSFDDAVEIIRAHLDASIGRSQKVMRAARASGEIRSDDADLLVLTADDGVVGMDLRPGAKKQNDVRFSHDDLMDWLKRNAPETSVSKAQPQHRYPTDASLVEQGHELMAAGMSKRQAARKLAHDAEGGDLDQRTERLRKLL